MTAPDNDARLAERDELLAMVAHELRNPLHALALQLALVRKCAQAGAGDELLPRLAKAEDMLARYVERAGVLLDLARADVGRAYPVSIEALDLAALLRDLAASLAPEAQWRGVHLDVDLPEACPASADRLIVEQVVENLLLNAFKHAAARRVTLRLDRRGDRALVEVADDGRGIAAEDRQRIFARHGIALASERGAGSGLGLWIVRKLVALLGGAIALESASGQGSRFVVTLPLSSPVGLPR